MKGLYIRMRLGIPVLAAGSASKFHSVLDALFASDDFLMDRA